MFSSRPIPRFFVGAFALSLALSGASGCLKKRASSEPPTTARVVPVKTGPTPPKIDYAAIRPNELGRIPVIMYHEVVEKPSKKAQLTRTVESFKKDLELLYAAGYRPVNLSDVINDRIDVPAGKSPVVLTFDDARPSQFKLVETATAQQIDPNCAMGIMEAFHKEHADWPMRATFFILPKSKKTMEPFGQLGLGNVKLNYIVSQGMEIGNHTTLHLNMHSMSPAQIQQEIGYANAQILAAVPTAKIETFAVPMGKFPRKENLGYLRKGTFEGKPYEFKAVMAAAWRPIPSPDSKEYNPDKLERIDAIDGTNGIRDWVSGQAMTRLGFARYISDGDPNVVSFPKGLESDANMEKIKAENKLVNTYSPFGGPGGAKPIVSASDSSVTETSASPTAAPGDAGAPTAKPIVGSEPPASPAPTSAGGAVSEKPVTGGH